MTRQEIRDRLLQISEPEYREFNKKLLPGVSAVLGVRVPKLRQMAKQAAKEDASGHLALMRETGFAADAYYEEKMFYGMVIGYAKMNDNEYKEWLDVFVPMIDNWGVCDSCCTTYKFMRKQPAFWWDYLEQQILEDTEFSVRFALVSMLDHFIDGAHIREILGICGGIRNEGYYARMAVAWLVSMCFVQFPEETYTFLQEDQMDDFTHNKSIQKACESYRVTKEWKTTLRGLRR